MKHICILESGCWLKGILILKLFLTCMSLRLMLNTHTHTHTKKCEKEIILKNMGHIGCDPYNMGHQTVNGPNWLP